MLIAGVAIYDSPDPGSGNMLAWAKFPGDGNVELYPGCVPLTFPKASIEISLDFGMRARPRTACISLEDGQVRYHPPAEQPHLRAMARLCERFDIPFSASDSALRLAVELALLHEPDTFRPAGRELTADERRLSIAWLIDQERRPNDAMRSVVERVRAQLVNYGLIDPDSTWGTVLRLIKEGNRLLAEQKWIGGGIASRKAEKGYDTTRLTVTISRASMPLHG